MLYRFFFSAIMVAMNMITLENVTFRYGNTEALHDVSFTVSEKSCCAIGGPSGSGKSTLLHVIAGLLHPTEGNVHIAESKTIAMIFQGAALFPHTRVKDNIAYGLHKAGYKRDEIEEMVKHTADKLHIAHLLNRYPSTLSGGEKQRVDIARAIVRKPDILLLDEPFASLDPSLRNELLDEIMRIKEEYGMTLVMVTHDQSDAMRMADTVYLLHQGEVIESGTPETLFDDPQSFFAASFFGALQANVYTVTVRNGAFSLFSVVWQVDVEDGTYQIVIRPSSFVARGTIPVLIESLARYEDRWLIKGRSEGEEVSLLLAEKPAGRALFIGLMEEKMLLFDQNGQRVRKKISA